MQKLAPVLITVYDRFDSLQNAISNLQKNELSKQTDLYIVSDYAYDVKHEEIINQIREYIKNIKGFKSVEGIFWDSNKGSFDSWYDATKYIFSKHDRLIIFEDDILVSNKFLEYMNTALEFYEDDKRIISIASHVHYKNIPYRGYPHEVFLLEMFSPWGVGMWKDRFESIDYTLDNIDEFINDREQIKEFNKISQHMMHILMHMLDNKKKYGDVITCIHMFKNKLYTLYPIKPLSVNRGHDGRGEHCGVDDKWQNQKLVNDFIPKLVKNIEFDKRIKKRGFKAFYSIKQHAIVPILQKIRIYNFTKKIYKYIVKK